MLTRIITGLVFMLALFAGSAQAQTTLNSGDIVFLGVNTTPSPAAGGDSYTFMPLVPLAVGTTILFTDRGVLANGTFFDNCALIYPNPCQAEQTATWTATSAVAAGTVITVTSTTGTDGMGNPGVVTTTNGTSNLALNLSNTGDGITAYQGTESTHTFLASINLSNSATDTNGFNPTVNGPTSCALPPGLVAGTSAIGMFPNSGTQFQNAQYDCTKGTSGTAATLRGWINNRANWLKQDTTLYGAIPCSFTVQTAAVPQISFSASTATVSEASNATLTLTRSLVTNTATSIDVTFTAGSATGGGTDFTSTTQTVSFAANQTSATVTIPITNDALDEDNETFTATLVANASGAQPAAPFSATVTITDDDTSGLTISKSALSVAEGGATDSYTLTLTAQPTANVQLLVNVPDGQANVKTTGAYAANVNVVFTPANWSTAQTVSVQAVDDALIETSPHSSSIQHSIALTGDARYAPLTFPTSTISITDNDVAPAIYNFSSAAYSVLEGNAGTTNAMIRINRTGNTALATTVTLSLANGAAPAATGGVDYDATPIVVSFAAGDAFKVVNVPVAGDFVAESDEHVALSLTSPSNSGQIGTTQPTAVLTINDDDVAEVLLSTSTLSIAEGGASDSYTLVLATQPSSNVIIVVVPSNSTGADLNASPSVLTFTPANWSAPQTVTVSAVDDSSVEGTETTNLTHTVASGDPGYDGFVLHSISVTIDDNDVTPSVYDFSAATYSVNEGDTSGFSANAVVRVNRTSNTAVASTVTITLAGSGSPAATAGTDFDATTLTVSFAIGDLFKDVNVPIAGDHIAEGDEQLTLTLANPSSGGQIGTTHSTALLTITDDDSAHVTITPTTLQIIEGGSAVTYDVVLTSQPTADVTFSVTSGMSELISTPSTLTFTAANWNVAQTITVTIVDDSVIEAPHTSSITHDTTSADINYDATGAPTVVVTVTDNDYPMPIYDFSVAGYDVTEGTATATIRVLRTSDTSAASTVLVTFTDGAAPSATPGIDYDATSITVSFAANEAMKDLDVPILDDSRHEPTEHVALSLANPSGAGQIGTTHATATLTITDDDAAAVAVSSNMISVTEGGAPATYALTLSSQPTADVTIAIATTSNDVTLSPASLVFTSANWNTPQSVTVTAVDDDEAELTETATIEHSVSSSDADYDAFTIAPVVATITDNDSASVERLLSFSAADAGTSISSTAGASGVIVLSALVQTPFDSNATELSALSLELSHAADKTPPPGGRVFVVLDVDGDGKIGAGDTELGSTSLNGTAGTIALSLEAPLTFAPGSEHELLLAYDLPSFPKREGLPLVLLLVAAALRRGRRRMFALGLFVTLMVLNASCTPNADTRAFELRAKVVGATATSGTVINGLPLTAATVTVKE